MGKAIIPKNQLVFKLKVFRKLFVQISQMSNVGKRLHWSLLNVQPIGSSLWNSVAII